MTRHYIYERGAEETACGIPTVRLSYHADEITTDIDNVTCQECLSDHIDNIGPIERIADTFYEPQEDVLLPPIDIPSIDLPAQEPFEFGGSGGFSGGGAGDSF